MSNLNASLKIVDVADDKDEARNRIAAVIFLIVSEMTTSEELINVTYVKGEKTTVYKIDVPVEHRGRLIGANGRNILSLRNLIQAMGANNGFRAVIDLVV